MTDSLASGALSSRCEQLFVLVALVTMTAEKLKEIWPLVSSVYIHRKKEKKFKGTLKVSQDECRRRKVPKSPLNVPTTDYLVTQIERPESATSL
jgi:hypothetical protein